jgi:immune inhibitor A
MENKNFFTSTAGIIIVVLVVLCCCCFVIFAGGLGGLYYIGSQVTPFAPDTTPFNFNFDDATPTPVEITRVPISVVSTETLKTVENALVPINDPRDLACRLEGKCNIPETLPSGPFKVDDKQTFWLTNTDNAKNFQVNATLKYVTDHAYFWVEDNVSYNQKAAEKLLDTFETKIYPTDREFFGSEWTPGVDNDPHIYIVYARGIGGVNGYFGSGDEYHPDAKKYSNAHEMFVFSADHAQLEVPYTYSTLAHEFQHMIHWKQDRNEASWMNEGFAEVAAFLNGYDVGGSDYAYASDPDLQLTDWVGDSNDPDFGRHYGESFLFMTYFLDRFGEEASKALVKDQQNGMESIDNVLKSINATDKTTGQPVTANDVFMDWAVTNYLLDGSVGDGRFVYHNYPDAPRVMDTESIYDCPTKLTSTVHQYGVDYIHFSCNGKYTLRFEGSNIVGLLPVDANSGKYAFWTNKGDESDMTLTREFDFSSASGALTLKYHTWYDLEKDYDYVFVEASTDGKTWQILKTPSGTDSNPSGNSYGWGYNNKSNGWIEESVDLSQYKGQKVQVRFEYVTDAAVNGEGFMVDDISIPEINYSTDFEADNGGWEGAGFVRVENILPQTFRLALINKNGGTIVQTISVAPDQTAEINVDLSDATLVISGITPFTREDGHYTVTVK